MNTHSDRKPRTHTLIFVFSSVYLFHLVFVSLAESTRAEDQSNQVLSKPKLQRTIVNGTKTYTFDFATARGPAFPALIELDNVSLADDERTHSYHLFGMTHSKPQVAPLMPLRWGTSESMLFVVREFPAAFGPPTPRIFRFPFDAIVSRVDWADCLDRNKIGDKNDSPNGWNAPHYVNIEPIRTALFQKFILKNNEELSVALGRASTAALPEIHYDIGVLDARRIELFMTVNGKLSRWLFDGKKWTLREKYSVEIHGPFLVYRDGNAILSELDGKWCVIDNLQEETPNIRVLMDAPPQESLLLIEDVVQKTNYFQLGRSLYNEEGVKIANLSAKTKPAQRMTEALEIVLYQRQ